MQMTKFDQAKILENHLCNKKPIKIRPFCIGRENTFAGVTSISDKNDKRLEVTNFLNNLGEEPTNLVLVQDSPKGKFVCALQDLKDIISEKFIVVAGPYPNEISLKPV